LVETLNPKTGGFPYASVIFYTALRAAPPSSTVSLTLPHAFALRPPTASPHHLALLGSVSLRAWAGYLKKTPDCSTVGHFFLRKNTLLYALRLGFFFGTAIAFAVAFG